MGRKIALALAREGCTIANCHGTIAAWRSHHSVETQCCLGLAALGDAEASSEAEITDEATSPWPRSTRSSCHC